MTYQARGRWVAAFYMASVVVALYAFKLPLSRESVLAYGVASWFGGVFFDRLLHRFITANPAFIQGVKHMSQYWKAIIAASVAVLIVTIQTVVSQRSDGVWTTEDTLITVLAVLGAVGVYFKANTPPAGERPDPDLSVTER